MTGPTPLKMLQEVMTLDLMEVASTLVKLYLGQGKIQPYLDVVCIEEIHNTGKSYQVGLNEPLKGWVNVGNTFVT